MQELLKDSSTLRWGTFRNLTHIFRTRGSSADEIANVDFLARGSGYVLERRFTKFSEIMQCKRCNGRSRSSKATDFGIN